MNYLLNFVTRTFLCLLGPQPDWDPDIVEGLDDDFDFNDPDNMLDDDFMMMANAARDKDDG